MAELFKNRYYNYDPLTGQYREVLNNRNNVFYQEAAQRYRQAYKPNLYQELYGYNNLKPVSWGSEFEQQITEPKEPKIEDYF